MNNPDVGDILIDCYGNKMVVLNILEGIQGECSVLLNGRVRIVNTSSSSITSIVKKEDKHKSSNNAKKRRKNG